MSSIDRHPTLRRQLRRLGLDGAPSGQRPTAEQWQAFLARVDLAYSEADQARALLERSLELSSREMCERMADQRHHDEARLLARQQRMTSMFEVVPTPLLALDSRGRVTAANPAALRAYGPLEQLRDRTLDEVLDHEVMARSRVVALDEEDELRGSLVVVAAGRDRQLAAS